MKKWSNDSVIFCKVKEEWGGYSNMSCEYKVRIGNVLINHCEGLYQSLRYPDRIDIQKEIIKEKSPMSSKMKSKKYYRYTRKDWDDVKEDIMYWCLKVKLYFNWNKFSKLLLESGERNIVEKSRRDRFWGAVDMVGENRLGVLLMKLREEVKVGSVKKGMFPKCDVDNMIFLGENITNPNKKIISW